MRKSGTPAVIVGACLASATVYSSSFCIKLPLTPRVHRRGRVSRRSREFVKGRCQARVSQLDSPGRAAADQQAVASEARTAEQALGSRWQQRGTPAALASSLCTDEAPPAVADEKPATRTRRRNTSQTLADTEGVVAEERLLISSRVRGDEDALFLAPSGAMVGFDLEQRLDGIEAATGVGDTRDVHSSPMPGLSKRRPGASAARDSPMSRGHQSRDGVAWPPAGFLDDTHPLEEKERQREQQHEDMEIPSRAGNGGGGDEGVGLWASRALLVGSAALYGTNFACVKLLQESVPMSLVAAWRFSLAVLPFVPHLLKVKPGVLRAGLEIGLFNAVGYWAQSQSLATTTASKSAFICSLAVVLIPLLDSVFARRGAAGGGEQAPTEVAEKKKSHDMFSTITSSHWFPALLAVAGVACLELIGGTEGGSKTGDLWALIQPIGFGLGFWRTERLARKYPGDTQGIVAVQLLIAAVLAIVWCVVAGDIPLSLEASKEILLPASGSLAVAGSLLWTGFMTTSLTQFWETLAMKQVSAAESTVILSSEPIWGTAFAAVILGETVGWNTGIGALLIVSACIWSSLGSALVGEGPTDDLAGRDPPEETFAEKKRN